MSRETIAVDMDDVLASHYESVAEFMNERYGHEHTAADYHSSLAELWDVDVDEAVRRMWEFHGADLLGDFAAKPDAAPALERLGEDFDLIVVTARPSRAIESSRAWLDDHFPAVFKQIAFIHPFEGDPATKADKCREFAASYLIDDTLKHCVSVAEAGIGALLFGVHESRKELPEGVTAVMDWEEVVEYFDGRG